MSNIAKDRVTGRDALIADKVSSRERTAKMRAAPQTAVRESRDRAIHSAYGVQFSGLKHAILTTII
jgi:hypothetical protein